MRNVKTVREEYKLGKPMTIVGFWGNKDVTEQEASFSNFYHAPFRAEVTVDTNTNQKQEVEFTNSEQYFMYLKAYLFKDNEVMKEIIKGGKAPYEYKQLGRRVKNYNDSEWNRVRYMYMKQALGLKFTSTPVLKNNLLATGDAVLVEASPFDRIWGIGMGKRCRNGRVNADWLNPMNWKGDNLLGFALMDVRDGLVR